MTIVLDTIDQQRQVVLPTEAVIGSRPEYNGVQVVFVHACNVGAHGSKHHIAVFFTAVESSTRAVTRIVVNAIWNVDGMFISVTFQSREHPIANRL